MSTRHTCALLLTDNEYLADAAHRYAASMFHVVHASRHGRAERTVPPPLERVVGDGNVDFLFNFLAPMIVPASVLNSIRRGAVNFHPAPPEWPGIGSASFAIYHGDDTFGVTAHVMRERVDSGPIIRTIRFPILATDTCDILFERAEHHALALFYSVLPELVERGQTWESGERWGRASISRREFESWMVLSPDDPAEEFDRKIKALRHYRLPGPFVEVHGYRFALLPPKK